MHIIVNALSVSCAMRNFWTQPILCPILTRKVNEAILIGENIRIMVVEIRGKQVRLGIEAPANLLVIREENIKPKET